jgi:hypothetical protein
MKDTMTPAAVSAAAKGDILNFLVASTPGGIEAQEAQGQRTFVGSQTLPIICPRTELEALGFKFGKPADDLFVTVEFPGGWQKKATDHSMHSHLLDPQGRRRGGIFYKAAFYDQSAHMYGLDCYYRITEEHGDKYDPIAFHACSADKTKLFSAVVPPGLDYRQKDALRQKCMAWLTENFPEWESPLAYW